MKAVNEYLIQPLGERYNNVKQIGGKDVIVNTTMDETDFKYTNRIAEVVAVPRYEEVLEVGDKIIVHHNTFRKWFNVRGHLKNSSNFIKEGQFFAEPDMIFAYNRGDGWVTLSDYCFIEHQDVKENAFGLLVDDKKCTFQGKVHFTNPILEVQGVKVGDNVVFDRTAAYKFEIDGKTLYKMSAHRNIKLVL